MEGTRRLTVMLTRSFDRIPRVLRHAGDDFDPHAFRNVDQPLSNWQAMANFLKASVGTGVLAMPVAFMNAGYVNGLILTIILALITVYCLHVLIRSMYELCKRKQVPYLTFSEAMKIGFEEGPPFLKCIVPVAAPCIDGFLAFYHFGICCVYVVFISNTNKQILDEYYAVIDIRIHMCFVLLPLFLIFSIRNLGILAFFCVFANMLLIVGFGVILYYIFQDLPSLSERKQFQDIRKLPIFFGTVLFSLEAVGVILTIEERMQFPKDFLKPLGVLNVGMTIISILYVLLGFFGYWKYGETAKGSITLNIPQDEVMAQATKLLFAFTIWISYAVQGYVTNDIIWHKYLSKREEDTSKHFLFEMLTRASIVICTFCCALVVPKLSHILSLVGSFCLSILGLIFPALLEICVQYSSGYGKYKIYLIKNVLLLIFGIFGGMVGTYTSIIDIIETYRK